jgi:hypothetical protein
MNRLLKTQSANCIYSLEIVVNKSINPKYKIKLNNKSTSKVNHEY